LVKEMEKHPKSKVIKSKPIDMVYEGINKQEAAQKELREKRISSKTAHKDKAKLTGGIYKGRYD